MLPSRGIVRSLGATRQIPTRTLGNGRQFGTLRHGGLTATTLRAKVPMAPITLGSVASARNLSLWGYGSKKTTPEPPAPTPEAIIPDQTPQEAAESAAAALQSTAQSSHPADLTAATAGLEREAPEALTQISSLVNSGSEILARPEGLGYLSSLGLDYGWGFTSTMQWVLEHVHFYTGMGWAGAIMTTAVLIRVAMFYPQVQSTKFTMDMKRMQEDPRHKEVMANIQKAIRSQDRVAQQQAQLLNNILRREYDVPFSKMIWSFVPIPFSIGFFRILNGMTSIPVPSLETSGYLWFTDLTVADPYMILPCVATGIMVLSINFNMANSPPAQVATMKRMQWVLIPVMIIGTSFLSAAVNLMAVALAAATAVSQAIISNPSARRALGIPMLSQPPPPPPAPAYEAPRQPETLKQKLTGELDTMKKGLTDTMDKFGGSFRGTEADQAEKKRREARRKLEEKRSEQERRSFEEKYKGKK